MSPQGKSCDKCADQWLAAADAIKRTQTSVDVSRVARVTLGCIGGQVFMLGLCKGDWGHALICGVVMAAMFLYAGFAKRVTWKFW